MFRFSRRCRRVFLAAAFVACLPLTIAAGSFSAAQAQAQAQDIDPADFREALEPYGEWRPHPRWGEVWVVSRRPSEWRPYFVGHWVYTDEWGWYWVSEEEEADWGWIVYHYGRWIFDPNIGWAWIPGDEWAPAWVTWRQGGDFVGWAALPPDEIFDEDYNVPQPWLFVSWQNFAAPRQIWRHVVPRQRVGFYIQRSNVVNRTFGMHNRRFAVNPGIPPAFVARKVGRPLRTYAVQPRVLAGTARIEGAVVVRRGERGADRRGGSDRFQERVTIRQTPNVIAPSAAAAPLQPLRKGEGGRLGNRPPRAAQSVAPGGGQQPDAAPSGGQQPGGTPEQRRRQGTPETPQRPPEQRQLSSPPQGGVAPAPAPGGAAPVQRQQQAPAVRQAPPPQQQQRATPQPRQQQPSSPPQGGIAPAPAPGGAAPVQRQQQAPAVRQAPPPQQQRAAPPQQQQRAAPPPQRQQAAPPPQGRKPPPPPPGGAKPAPKPEDNAPK